MTNTSSPGVPTFHPSGAFSTGQPALRQRRARAADSDMREAMSGVLSSGVEVAGAYIVVEFFFGGRLVPPHPGRPAYSDVVEDFEYGPDVLGAGLAQGHAVVDLSDAEAVVGSEVDVA